MRQIHQVGSARGVRGWVASLVGRPAASPRRAAHRPGLESLERREVLTTVQAFEAALGAQIQTTVAKFVQDAATVEYYRPTLASGAIDQLLVQTYNDNRNGQVLQEFSDIQALGKSMFAEAVVATAYHLPASDALAAYSAIQSDLTNVVNVKTELVTFLDYIADHTQYHATAKTSTTTMMASGLFSAGTIGGNTQAALNQEYQNSLTHYSAPTAASYDHYYASLSGSIAANAQFDQEAQTGDYPGQDLSDED